MTTGQDASEVNPKIREGVNNKPHGLFLNIDDDDDDDNDEIQAGRQIERQKDISKKMNKQTSFRK